MELRGHRKNIFSQKHKNLRDRSEIVRLAKKKADTLMEGMSMDEDDRKKVFD